MHKGNNRMKTLAFLDEGRPHTSQSSDIKDVFPHRKNEPQEERDKLCQAVKNIDCADF